MSSEMYSRKGNFTPQKVALKDFRKENIERCREENIKCSKILNAAYREIVLLENQVFIRTAVKRSVPSLF